MGEKYTLLLSILRYLVQIREKEETVSELQKEKIVSAESRQELIHQLQALEETIKNQNLLITNKTDMLEKLENDLRESEQSRRLEEKNSREYSSQILEKSKELQVWQAEYESLKTRLQDLQECFDNSIKEALARQVFQTRQAPHIA